jgi:hypothetical protein
MVTPYPGSAAMGETRLTAAPDELLVVVLALPAVPKLHEVTKRRPTRRNRREPINRYPYFLGRLLGKVPPEG